jgi:short-subunit dehydrogenase
LFGYVHGARAVLPIFREQGHGVLVNVGSVLSRTSEPYVAPYATSKHGIRALGMALRQELLIDKVRGVHVCTVMPGTIDTPLFPARRQLHRPQSQSYAAGVPPGPSRAGHRPLRSVLEAGGVCGPGGSNDGAADEDHASHD